jgi:hypothetical protein
MFVEGMILREHVLKEPQRRDDFCFYVIGYRFGERCKPLGTAGARARRDFPPSDPPITEEVPIAVAS